MRLDGEDLLVRRAAALQQKAEATQRAESRVGDGRGAESDPRSGETDTDSGGGGPQPKPPRRPTHFYGRVKLDSLKVGSSAGVIGDELVKHLAALVGSKVEVFLEITASVPDGVPESIERAVTENARQLKFQSFEFEEE